MKAVKVQIITIGDELLIGQIVDTNSAWMGEILTREGFEVVRRESIGDDAKAIGEALGRAMENADVVLLTGGLGPTKDDITIKTLAAYFKSGMVFNQEVFKNVERIIMPRVGRVNALNRSQAEVPEKARIFINTLGTAPILWFEENSTVVVSMPGVPHEMKHALEFDILPELKVRFNLENRNRYKTIVVSGITEAELAENLASFEEALPNHIKLAYLPSPGYIKLRLTGKDVGAEFEPFLDRLKCEVADILVSDDEILPERILAGRLLKLKLTIATAESCTGGLIAHKITSVPGCSAYFKGSVVAYHNAVKTNLLNVPKEMIEAHGAVSEEVVRAMALGAAVEMNADLAIATSGIAGPDGGTEDKPVGTVWVAWYVKGEVHAKKVFFPATRGITIERTSTFALMELNKYLNRL